MILFFRESAVTGTGIESVVVRRLNGGWRVEVAVDGVYAIKGTPDATGKR